MFGTRLAIGWACFVWPLFNVAVAQGTIGSEERSGPVPASSRQPRQVRLVHLEHADAAAMVEKLRRIAPSGDVRIVAYRKTNSVIVVAPAAMSDALGNLIARLDVPPARTDARPVPAQIRDNKAVPHNGVGPGAQAPGAGQPGDEGGTLAVMRASPALQKAVQAFAGPPAAQQEPGHYRGTAAGDDFRIEVLHLSGVAAKALAQLFSAHGPEPGVAAVAPSRPANRDAPPAPDTQTAADNRVRDRD